MASCAITLNCEVGIHTGPIPSAHLCGGATAYTPIIGGVLESFRPRRNVSDRAQCCESITTEVQPVPGADELRSELRSINAGQRAENLSRFQSFLITFEM